MDLFMNYRGDPFLTPGAELNFGYETIFCFITPAALVYPPPAPSTK